MVKTEIRQGDNQAFMWLSNVRKSGTGFVAEFFEIPHTFTEYAVGDQFEIAEGSVLDWMVNDNGVLHGGFSIRYQRSGLSADELAAYDEYIGVTEYA